MFSRLLLLLFGIVSVALNGKISGSLDTKALQRLMRRLLITRSERKGRRGRKRKKKKTPAQAQEPAVLQAESRGVSE